MIQNPYICKQSKIIMSVGREDFLSCIPEILLSCELYLHLWREKKKLFLVSWKIGWGSFGINCLISWGMLNYVLLASSFLFNTNIWNNTPVFGTTKLTSLNFGTNVYINKVFFSDINIAYGHEYCGILNVCY